MRHISDCQASLNQAVIFRNGVDAIVRMAVDYGHAIGLDSSDLLLALLMTQFIGFYNMLCKFAAVPGLLMIGLIAAMSDSS